MKAPAFDQLKTGVKEQSLPWFSEGEYNLNLVGIRSADRTSNSFNDLICCAFYQGGNPNMLTFSATTDPGAYWLHNPMNVAGTAIMAPGHYPGMWTIGKHRNKYDALIQRGPVQVYRDNNRDGTLDMENPDQGMFGINLHKAGSNSVQVDRWSAGCQVIARKTDFDLLMCLVFTAAREWGPSFSYTLLDESQMQ